ncbi:Glu/Leu/Phe/Val dehydrogenase family protein [Conexibacter woesei]|uniref:Glu/Leu/Phe/Val dehydrogenase dimerization region n=1 Tax=Conexibacter woesei (strain DSM 14684 / CCUG 47730 / CIP 108061 / JCM 11494 / NBRC 100937 / ID131577) TaxID=469383 RepID=D3F700_CONWI|nr:Glu/Leu/Phe/Val dehydrogenase family protein [Conexibacter woesei]ADB52798.1 Glu/Leu/Phe/Val dehydrogenase dimerization region [Conexibacter woesei DSM 14684]
MSTRLSPLDHERLIARRGARSGLLCIVAVHSTAAGFACGGMRILGYEDRWQGVDDALRLSRGMTYKCAAAGLAHGGGKGVIALAPGEPLEGERRIAALHDFGDLVESLDGAYGTSADVGSSAEDMVHVRERTRHAYSLPARHGGGGEPSAPTAAGLERALDATCRARFASDDVGGRTVAVLGLGQVGGRIARRLAARGAALTVSDVDPAKQALAAELGATWVDPDTALTADVDVLVPCALGGVLNEDSVPRLRCRAIVGAANNQLAHDGVADLVHARGILWAPDFVANAGGVIYAVTVDVDGGSWHDPGAHLDVIGENLDAIFTRAAAEGTTPLHEAMALAEARIAGHGAGAGR